MPQDKPTQSRTRLTGSEGSEKSPPTNDLSNLPRELKRGWTTGACATAATKAAVTALLTGKFPDPVTITLPKGQTPAFALALEGKGEGWAAAGIIKDAGDDPDVTHGALIIATLRLTKSGGLTFKAGTGVGTITRAGLPLNIGEPAINPVPRAMMAAVIAESGLNHVEIEISIPQGAQLAEKTWNPRLGIMGGLSILGTTGIVNPFSCAAWIASIHQGVNVARAAGLTHLAGATGSTSEKAVQSYHQLPDLALIDMGDFVGGLLKYLRNNPVQMITIAGGFGKITKLAQGAMDLHSGRSQVDFSYLASLTPPEIQQAVLAANTSHQVLGMLSPAKAQLLTENIAEQALSVVRKILQTPQMKADVLIIGREGQVLAHAF